MTKSILYVARQAGALSLSVWLWIVISTPLVSVVGAAEPLIALLNKREGPLDTMVVSDHPGLSSTEFSLREQERTIGMDDDVAAFIYLKSDVNRVPESNGQLLMKGEGPYDSDYRLFDIPLFTISHFTQLSHASRSGLMIANINDIAVLGFEQVGRSTGGSAGTVLIKPYYYHRSNVKLHRRPELMLTMGKLDCDFSLRLFPRNGNDRYQLSWSLTDAVKMKAKQRTWFLSSTEAALGYGTPNSMADVTYEGENQLGAVRIRHHLWLAADDYGTSAPYRQALVPWGMGTIAVEERANNPRWKVYVGGAQQHLYESKKYGSLVPFKHVQSQSAVAGGEWNEIDLTQLKLRLGATLEHLQWKGELRFPQAGTMMEHSVKQQEQRLALHAGVRKDFVSASAGVDMLGVVLLPARKPFADLRIWSLHSLGRLLIDMQAGLKHSQPDIRGVPDSSYRATLARTWFGSLSGSASPCSTLQFSLGGYVKHKSAAPSFANYPGWLLWDADEATPLVIGGLSGQVDWDMLPWLSLFGNGLLARSTRLEGEKRHRYEWDVPWSVRSVVKAHFFEDRMQLFLTGTFAEGLPYREVMNVDSQPLYGTGGGLMPYYKRIDFKAQFSQSVKKVRWLTQYDVYLDIMNMVNFISMFRHSSGWDIHNMREYYWDSNNVKHPVFLEHTDMNIGARIGFRL